MFKVKLFDNILTDVEVDSNKFTDCDMWAKDSILQLSSLGLVNGYSDNIFRPNNHITRAEAVTIINRIIGRDVTFSTGNSNFSDVPESHWAYPQIINAIK